MDQSCVPWSLPHTELSQPPALAVSPLIWNRTNENEKKKPCMAS